MPQSIRLILVVAVLLFAGGVWANLGKAPFSEMRGAWVSQAMR